MTGYGLRPEQPKDADAIWTVVREAFQDRAGADLVGKLRASGDVVPSLVCEDQGEIVGYILFSRMTLAGVRAVGLAPLAVLPGRQSEGIGSALVRAGLEQLRARGEQAVFGLGHRQYYPRFGFRSDLAAQFESPYAGDSFFASERKGPPWRSAIATNNSRGRPVLRGVTGEELAQDGIGVRRCWVGGGSQSRSLCALELQEGGLAGLSGPVAYSEPFAAW